MGIVRGTLFIVGTSIGAGFLSGAELVRFFRGERFFLPVLVSCALFFAMCLLYLHLGKKYGGYRSAMKILCGRGAPAVYGVVFLCAFIPSAGMLAGLDALLPSLSPLLSLAGIALAAGFLWKGMKGISALNLILVPALLIFVFVGGRGEVSYFYPVLPEGTGGFAGGTVYAGMNAFLAAPVLMDAGKEMKKILPTALFSSLIVAASAMCILGRIYREGAGAIGAEMPFLYVMRGRKIFFVAVACAILTSLVSALYPLVGLCDGFTGRKKYAAKGAVLLAAFALSRVGLSGIVRYFYPLLGCVGLVFSTFCVLNDQLFQKHHKKVHTRGKYAENTSCGHHEIEFKHLPAVNDKVSEPRARHNIFSHNRADPRHAHVDFEHGDERRE